MDVQNSGSPRLVDEYSTAIFDWLNPQPRLAMIGGLGLLAARSSGLTVLDLRDEAHPRWVSSLNTQGEARAVVTQGALAYVGDSSFTLNDGLNQAEVAGEGLVAVDLTDPAQPVRLGATLESEVIRDVAVGGETIYVATDDHGLAIVDASNNQDLRVVGYYREGEPAQAVSVQGKQAYISYADRIEMLDISDGQIPRKTGELHLQYYSGFDANPRPFFVSEKEVVVSTYDSDWGVHSQTLLDFHDPANPLQVGRLQTSASWIAGVGDDVIFVVGDRLEAYSFDKLASPQHLAAHDLNEPSSSWAGWYDVAVSGPLGFFVDSAGLSVFDLSDAHSPVQIGAVASEALGVGDIPSNPSKRIAADKSGTRVVVSGVVNTRIVDVSDPSRPLPRGFIPKPALQIRTHGDRIYLAIGDGSWPSESGIAIVDASSPDSPAVLATFTLGSEYGDRVHAIAATDTLAYLVGPAAFATVDMHDPRSPTLLSRLDLHGLNFGENDFEYGGEIELSGTHAFVAAGYAGMLVIDVADPHNPRVVGSLPGTAASVQGTGHGSHGSFSDVAVRGSVAYLFDSHQGRLVAVDVSDPTRPRMVGRNTLFAGEGHAGSMEVTDDFVFVAFLGGYPDLVMFDRFTMLRFGPASVEADGMIRLPVDGASGQRVRLQRSENLVDWEDWQTMTLGGNATGCGLIDTTTAARQRFYRVVEDKPTLTDNP